MLFALALLAWVMSQFAILRLAKLKGMGHVRSAGAHNLRTRETPNADPHGPAPVVLHGPADLGDAVAERLREAGVKKPRKDAVLCSEMVLTGSPERMHAMNRAELKAWAADNVAWLREKHGANLVQVVLHLDEQTPHIHAAIVPINPNGGLSAKRYWGEAAGLTALQTEYGERMAPHGLVRGIEGSKARHATLRAFYGAVEAAQTPTPPGPMPDRPRAEDGALLGLVKATAVAEAERGWRRQLVRWGKSLLMSEERARLAAAGLASENRAMKREREEAAHLLTKARTVMKTWRLLAKHVPDEFKALVSDAKRREQEQKQKHRLEEQAKRQAAWDAARRAPEPPLVVPGPRPNPYAAGKTKPSQPPLTPPRRGGPGGRSR